MRSVDYWQNSDGSWSARIFNDTRTFSTRDAALAWLRASGEQL